MVFDNNWTYKDLGDYKLTKDYLQEIVTEICDEYNYSEHYRGIDYHKCKYPPKEILKISINDTKLKILRLQDYLVMLERQFSEKYSKE